MPTALPRGQGWCRVSVGLSALDGGWVAWRWVSASPQVTPLGICAGSGWERSVPPGWGGAGLPEALAGGSGLCGVVLTASCLTDPVEFLVPRGTSCASVPV